MMRRPWSQVLRLSRSDSAPLRWPTSRQLGPLLVIIGVINSSNNRRLHHQVTLLPQRPQKRVPLRLQPPTMDPVKRCALSSATKSPWITALQSAFHSRPATYSVARVNRCLSHSTVRSAQSSLPFPPLPFLLQKRTLRFCPFHIFFLFFFIFYLTLHFFNPFASSPLRYSIAPGKKRETERMTIAFL